MIKILYLGYDEKNMNFHEPFEEFLKNYYGRMKKDDVIVKNVRKLSNVKAADLKKYDLIIADHANLDADPKIITKLPDNVPIIMTSSDLFTAHLEKDPKKNNLHYINKSELVIGVTELNKEISKQEIVK